ncbi:MAG TPA: hypothetical protein VFT41_02530 [Gemmatimonadaceae bacterium]|nr:hypothetical protein [Gemmatimonadaceae bacterium]
MEPFRLKLKVGPHEFEAEGDQESVEKQLAIWRELIGSPIAAAPALASPPPVQPPANASTPATPAPVPPLAAPSEFNDYSKVFRYDGKVVSLSIKPDGKTQAIDAALLLLLGIRHFTKEDLVTGAPILAGLQQSGISVARVDRLMGSEMAQEFVLRVGQHRGTKYRLSNPGHARAMALAVELAARVP